VSPTSVYGQWLLSPSCSATARVPSSVKKPKKKIQKTGEIAPLPAMKKTNAMANPHSTLTD
jgi:hypothetical protein